MKTLNTFLSEASLGRVMQHTKERNVGMLTAHRNEYSEKENKERNEQLKADIKAAGFGYIHVKGRYTENKGTDKEKHVDEHSFFVVGKKGDDKGELKRFLVKHGQKYEQDSVLHKAHNEKEAKLHGTTDRKDAWIKKGDTHAVGQFHANRAPEFHSMLKNGRKFSFEESAFVDFGFSIDRERSFFQRGPALEIEF